VLAGSRLLWGAVDSTRRGLLERGQQLILDKLAESGAERVVQRLSGVRMRDRRQVNNSFRFGQA
jgi:hypothetical protein